MLQSAMDKLPKNANYSDFLKTVGPQLLTTPGGAQLLGELAPIIQNQSRAAALQADRENRKSLQTDKQPNAQGQDAQNPQGRPSQQQPDVNINIAGLGQGGGENYIRNPIAPNSPESTYPIRSLPRKPEPLRNSDQLNQRRMEVHDAIVENGGIPDQALIESTVQNEEDNKIRNNDIIAKENETLRLSQENRQNRLLDRFNSAFPNASPEERNVFERFANEANNAQFENDQYEHGRRKYIEYETAKNAITRGQDIAGPLTNLYRKHMNTYKSKEDLLKGLMEPTKKLIGLGLENEARDLLSNSVGLGAEDTEFTMFPPTKEQSKQFNDFPINKEFKNQPSKILRNAKIGTTIGGPLGMIAGAVTGGFQDLMSQFPGKESELGPKEFINFKDNIKNVIQKNPGLNLISFRGIVNHDKHYAWTDYDKALNELISEGIFKPDAIQLQQMNVVRNPPLPGLEQQFNEVWKGTR
jgi:hypothetical protein